MVIGKQVNNAHNLNSLKYEIYNDIENNAYVGLYEIVQYEK